MSFITVRGARLHNLKNVTLAIPKNKLVVFSGLSGSGKSTMAFDTLHREGQRQYMESLGMVAHASQPPFDSVEGLSPSISVGQELTNRSPRSTVGTATDVYTYLRVLYARVGHRPCPRCSGDVPPSHEAEYPGLWDEEGDTAPGEHGEGTGGEDTGGEDTGGEWAGVDEDAPLVACPHCGARLPEMNMAMFSFNKPAGACPTCTGLGTIYAPNLAQLLDEEKSILAGAVTGWDIHTIRRYEGTLRNAGKHYGFDFDLAAPVRELGAVQRDLLLYGVRGRPFQARFPGVELPPTVAKGFFEGIVTNLLRRRTEHADDVEYVEKIDRLLREQTCPDCGGARLRAAARTVTVTGRPLVAPVGRAGQAVGAAAQMPLGALAAWVEELREVLPPDDWSVAEPIVADLRVRAQRLADVGLGYLTLEQATPSLPAARRRSTGPYLAIHGAQEHNLQDITVRLPLRAEGEPGDVRAGMLLAVTGVSGSGKSSLMFDILDKAARQRFFGAAAAPGAHAGITGWEHLDKIITIDQAPIGRSTRSNAATYTDAFTAIRDAFAAQPEALARGLVAQHFSFNVPGGRCERCEGSGVLAVEMQLLPSVLVRCPSCRGRRYKREVLAVLVGGYDIAQVLEMTIAEALALFGAVPAARARLQLMADTGLGYLQLGQPASTFSGGEAQRVKLARELARRATGRTLYLLDEPTTGLHPADTAHLLGLLQRLVAAGNTVVVIEHNLDVIKVADWVIDLGPEGGMAGGQVIAEGTPEDVAKVQGSHTGEMLRRVLD